MSDIFDLAIGGLKADPRSFNEIERHTGVPAETLRDIKSGRVKSPRITTIRRLAEHYCFRAAQERAA